jgi:hypothetical protein
MRLGISGTELSQEKEQSMELYDVVTKLVGPTNPVGETRADDERFENLKALTGLVDQLLVDIDRIACANNGRPEFSMTRAGKFCAEFLTQLGIHE